MSDRVLVTGGSGFIGTNLVSSLLHLNYEVCNVDLVAPQSALHSHCYTQADINDLEVLKKIVEDFSPSKIFHLAARTDLDGSSLESYKSNIQGVENIIKIANTLTSLDFVGFCSSMLVCSLDYNPSSWDDYAPDTIYGQSKMIGEKLVKSNIRDGVNWCILRPTSVWGPWFSSPYSDFFKMLDHGTYVHPAGISIFRNYAYVENLVDQLIRLSMLDLGALSLDRHYYLADYKATEIGEWADEISVNLNKRKPVRLPLIMFTLMAKIGDILRYLGWEKVPLTSFRLKNMLTERVFDMSHLENAVGGSPFSRSRAIERTVEWMNRGGK